MPQITPGKVKLDLVEACRKAGYSLTVGPYKHRGKPNAALLCARTGLAYTTIWGLLRQPEKIHRLDLDTIARLCHALQCQPGDILAYDPQPTGPRYERPLNPAVEAQRTIATWD